MHPNRAARPLHTSYLPISFFRRSMIPDEADCCAATPTDHRDAHSKVTAGTLLIGASSCLDRRAIVWQRSCADRQKRLDDTGEFAKKTIPRHQQNARHLWVSLFPSFALSPLLPCQRPESAWAAPTVHIPWHRPAA